MNWVHGARCATAAAAGAAGWWVAPRSFARSSASLTAASTAWHAVCHVWFKPSMVPMLLL